MKHLNFLIISSLLTFAINSQAEKLYCYGADSHPYDEAGTFHRYFVGLDYDNAAGSAKIWKQVDNQETKISSGRSLIYNEQQYVLLSTINELDLIIPTDSYDFYWNTLLNNIRWTEDSPCFLKVDATNFRISNKNGVYRVLFDEDGRYIRNPREACANLAMPQTHNARATMLCTESSGDLNDLFEGAE